MTDYLIDYPCMRQTSRYSSFTPLPVAALLSVPACQTTPEVSEDPSPHSSAELIPEVETIRPGEPFTVGLRLTLDPGWHSYWLNPGDAGQPASIEWDLPDGYDAGEISWPYPHRIEEPSVVSYGYDNEVMLLTEITPPPSLSSGRTVTFAAQARWLVCENICLPAMADLEFEINVRDEDPAPNRGWRDEFEETRRLLPTVVESWQMSAVRSHEGYHLNIVSSGMALPSFDGAFFYINERGVLDHAAEQPVSDTDEGVRLSLMRSPYAREVAARLEGVLVIPRDMGSEDSTALAVVVSASVASRTDEN